MILFHRFLIGTAIIFFAGFSVWALLEYKDTRSVLLLVLGVFFLLVTAGFAYYLKNLRRFLGR